MKKIAVIFAMLTMLFTNQEVDINNNPFLNNISQKLELIQVQNQQEEVEVKIEIEETTVAIEEVEVETTSPIQQSTIEETKESYAETSPVATEPITVAPETSAPAQTIVETTTETEVEVTVNNGSLNGEQQNFLTNQLLAELNAIRAQAGKSALNLDAHLNTISAVRASEIHTVWSHTRPDGSRGIDMIDASKWRGENLSKIVVGGGLDNNSNLTLVANRVVMNWASSQSHYNNMINDNFTKVGFYTFVIPADNTFVIYTACLFSN